MLTLGTTTTELTDDDANTCFITTEKDLIRIVLVRETIKQNMTTEVAVKLMIPNVTKCTDKTIFIGGYLPNSSCGKNAIRSKCNLFKLYRVIILVISCVNVLDCRVNFILLSFKMVGWTLSRCARWSCQLKISTIQIVVLFDKTNTGSHQVVPIIPWHFP